MKKYPVRRTTIVAELITAMICGRSLFDTITLRTELDDLVDDADVNHRRKPKQGYQSDPA
jgi:hypothetical protein